MRKINLHDSLTLRAIQKLFEDMVKLPSPERLLKTI